MPVLSVRGLDVSFPGMFGAIRAVRGIDFDVRGGEVLCIVGESGSGKSVAALSLCGLLPPSARVRGSVRLGETEVTQADAETLRCLRGCEIGFVFQDPTTTLNPVLRIGRQITEGQVAQGLLRAGQAQGEAVTLLREVEIADPAGRAAQFPHQFSGGMRQRAVIAMAMAGHKRLIIADEPTTALDVTVQAQILDLLARRRRDTGAAVIFITHDLGVVAEIADRVLVMYAGRIVESGPVQDIFRRPRHPYTQALLRSMPLLDGSAARLAPIGGQPPNAAALPEGCAFHPRCPIGQVEPVCAGSDPALRPIADGVQAACHFGERPAARAFPATPHTPVPAASRKVLEVKGLRVHFPIRSGPLRLTTGVVKAVDGVDLTLHEGETLGLVGESGCGKTTTGRAIMGLIRPTGGQVVVDGRDITHLSRLDLRPVRRHMQYVFQDPYASLNPMLSAAELVAEPMRIHRAYEELGGAARVAELFDVVGLPRDTMGRRPRDFSGGQKQRISIARALALQPKLLILDEPVAALDVSIQAQIVNLLQDLQREFGLAYLFIAHDLSVVRHISDRVAVMYLGRIVEVGDREALYRTPTHPYTQSLLSAVPIPDPDCRGLRQRMILQGEIPNPADPPPGCAFHPRCVRATEVCLTERPGLIAVPGLASRSACHHAGIAA
jgi:peptide/nickel transport system ATP-binding protein